MTIGIVYDHTRFSQETDSTIQETELSDHQLKNATVWGKHNLENYLFKKTKNP